MPKNFPSRPTTDFAKEGLFNILEHQFSLQDLKILDLCAGTGNISLEFASRQAGHVTSVDMNYNCVRFIRGLITEHQLENEMDVMKADVRDYLRKTDKQFDLVFADPPYDANFHAEIVKLVFEHKRLTEDGLCIIEHGRQTDLSQLENFVEKRNFGNVHFSFFKA
ncbi:MAG: hypothetical protein K0R65_822 [Crocinitomicaceae bacterium]|nr:hypothetical protein [Crocinitomicaceae bacterium]